MAARMVRRWRNADAAMTLTKLHGRYDGLAYCSWNGLGREITEQRILDALQDLADNSIQGIFLPKKC